jgi:aerobic carbon-monoxide dehydrogenase medium subunit
MYPREFEYASPTSVKEVVSLLDEFGSQAKLLAGGQSLVPLMKLRLASPKYVIDINRISDLEYIRERSGFLLIGTLARHHDIERSELVGRKLPILAETASLIGDPQVRNEGTIGGSLVHADPAGDWGATIIAVRGLLNARSSKGERTIDSDHAFSDTLTSSLRARELLTEIQIPLPPKKSGGAYEKFERKTGDFATVGVAAQISVDAGGVCTQAGIGLASVAPTSMRAKKAEKALAGLEITSGSIAECALAASEEANPTDDVLRGSAEYKRAMVRVFTKRALRRAALRAGVTVE